VGETVRVGSTKLGVNILATGGNVGLGGTVAGAIGTLHPIRDASKRTIMIQRRLRFKC